MLNGLLKRYAKRLPYAIRRRMRYLRDLATTVSELGTIEGARSTPHYYSRLKPLLDKRLWHFLMPLQHLPETRPSAGNKPFVDSMQEEESDACILELQPQNRFEGCNISKQCWEDYNTKNSSQYGLTHQVLYYLVGLAGPCQDEVNYLTVVLNGQTIDNRLIQICSRIREEADDIARRGFPSFERDLFMEQIGICGLAGILDLAKVDWLERILVWQAGNGCFHKFRGEHLHPSNFDPHRYGNYRKRSERAMSKGATMCLSHRTSVALSALAAFIRRFVEELVSASNFITPYTTTNSIERNDQLYGLFKSAVPALTEGHLLQL
ncbi:unnamed protein product [Schistocephalus solidus]|uniref:Helitron_like_N domain-containing protein n=1 Tax=Schistocephalus solidus TaxID=70667 RepID=A0A183SEN9_SCHSO|nr:unnamed protein product [Schistocephalus solidus]